jgi:cobalt-precorrin 5A hydrolase
VAANTAVINGERLTIILVGDSKVPISETWGYEVKSAANGEEALNLANNLDAGAIIARTDISLNNLSKPFAVLKLRRIILGIGARKNITEGQVLNAIQYALEKANVPLERIDGFATVDIKKDEKSMLTVANRLGFEYNFVSVNELRAFTHTDLSPDSKFVKEKIGVGGVCERAALIAAGKNPHLILKKQKLNGVTVAVAEGE